MIVFQWVFRFSNFIWKLEMKGGFLILIKICCLNNNNVFVNGVFFSLLFIN